MSTKRLGLLLIITPVLGFLGWALNGGPSAPAGEMSGYGAFAMEFVGANTDQLHIAMGVAALGFGLLTASLIGLRAKILDKGASQSAFLAGTLLVIGFAATVVENGVYSAGAQIINSISPEELANAREVVSSAASMFTVATTAGGIGTAIFALGIGLLGFSMFQNETVHKISSSFYMLVGIYGVIGSILFYDQYWIIFYYASLVITTIAIGIELLRTGAD